MRKNRTGLIILAVFLGLVVVFTLVVFSIIVSVKIKADNNRSKKMLNTARQIEAQLKERYGKNFKVEVYDLYENIQYPSCKARIECIDDGIKFDCEVSTGGTYYFRGNLYERIFYSRVIANEVNEALKNKGYVNFVRVLIPDVSYNYTYNHFKEADLKDFLNNGYNDKYIRNVETYIYIVPRAGELKEDTLKEISLVFDKYKRTNAEFAIKVELTDNAGIDKSKRNYSEDETKPVSFDWIDIIYEKEEVQKEFCYVRDMQKEKLTLENGSSETYNVKVTTIDANIDDGVYVMYYDKTSRGNRMFDIDAVAIYSANDTLLSTCKW